MVDWARRFAGSLLGLALADALGAPYEGWRMEGFAWKPINLHRPDALRYTDDTDMAIGCTVSLVRRGGFDVEDMARTWAERADGVRGYGPGALECLRLIRVGVPWREAARQVYPSGSYGNGAAMRVAPLALWLHNQPGRLAETVELASSVTHAHPWGIQGALIMARAVAAALHTDDPAAVLRAPQGDELDARFTDRLRLAEGMLKQEPDQQPVVELLGNGVVAHESVVTALLIACWFYDRPFDELVGFCVSVGGDVDTIAAMAGAVWGAHRGVEALPDPPLDRLEDRGLIASLAEQLVELPAD